MRAVLLAASLLAAVSCSGGDAREPRRPSVLLVTLDTLRADHLSYDGYPRRTSPRLDALAAESVVFERAYAPIATTLPSHTTMLTGTDPVTHGVLANRYGPRAFVRTPNLLLLPQLFERAGYRTAAFVGAQPLARVFGLDPGFEDWSEPEGAERVGGETIERAVAWLDAYDGVSPCFLWVHLFDPHGPYAPPPDFDASYEGDRAAHDALLEARGIAERAARPRGREVDVRAAVDDYDAEVRYTDAQVGALLDALAARGLREDTVVVVAGDHGEGLGQHGEPGHGGIWDEQLRVPLLIRAPALEPRVSDAIVGLRDLAPTLLGLVDLPDEERYLDQCTGVDVLADGYAGRPQLGRSSMRRVRKEQIDLVLRTDEWTYVRRAGGVEELYHRASDPYERSDVSAERPDDLAELRALFDREADAQIVTTARLRPIDDRVREKLDALGY